MESQLERMLGEFESNPLSAGKALREMMDVGDGTFTEHALALIKSSPEAPGSTFLLNLLSSKDEFVEKLCDPSLIPSSDAVEMARRIQKVDPRFDVRVLKHMVASPFGSKANGEAVERMLALIPPFRMLPLLAQLLRHPSPRIRSKTVILAGRAGIGSRLVETCLHHEDRRVRANAVEALWDNRSPEVKSLLREASRDPDNRVAANAALGLYKLADTSSIGLIQKMTRHPSAVFRASAVWVIHETGDSRFLGTLGKLVSDPDTKVRHGVFSALAQIRRQKASAGAGDPLHICPFGRDISAAGMRKVWLTVRSTDGKMLQGLTPLQFQLTRGTELIADYSVAEIAAPPSLFFGVASPFAGETVSPLQKVCEESRGLCQPWFRTQDDWAKLDYEARTPAAGIARLMSTVSLQKSERHVLLLVANDLQPESLPELDAEKLLARAKCVGTRIHALLLIDERAIVDPQLDKLCRATGGRVVRVSSPSEAVSAIQDLYGCLLGSYEITYPANAQTSDPLLLQVSTGAASGEYRLADS